MAFRGGNGNAEAAAKGVKASDNLHQFPAIFFSRRPTDVHHWGKVEVQYYGQDEEAESAREVILSETGEEISEWPPTHQW